MPSSRLGLAAVLGLMLPVPLLAQEAPSLLARVQADGGPAADVPIAMYTGGTRRHVATTGSSGLAVVEFGRVRMNAGTPLAVFALTCGDRTEIALARSESELPRQRDGCRRDRLGAVVWQRTDRLDIVLGDAPRMTSRLAREAVRDRSGFRVQAGPVVAFASGEELSNIGTGFGGEALLGYDTDGGPGIGAGLGVLRHGLEGVDETMWRWSVTVEPRYTFHPIGWRARPYVVGRLAWQSLDSEEGARLATEKGWAFGGGGGIAFPIFLGAWADVSAHVARLSVDVADFDDSGRSGMMFDIGAAVRF